jgi:hypothetical protein
VFEQFRLAQSALKEQEKQEKFVKEQYQQYTSQIANDKEDQQYSMPVSTKATPVYQEDRDESSYSKNSTGDSDTYSKHTF